MQLSSVKNNTPFILHGEMTVEYDGRAASILPRGSYLIVHKSDGTILIHGARLTTPRNYMGPKSVMYHQESGGNDLLIIRKRNEIITITVFKIIELLELSQWDHGDVVLRKSEKDLVDMIVASPHDVLGIKAVETYREYRTDDGPVDIVLRDPTGCWHVIEVKREKVTTNACLQLSKYLDHWHKHFPGDKVLGYVAGPSITNKALEWCNKVDCAYVKISHSD